MSWEQLWRWARPDGLLEVLILRDDEGLLRFASGDPSPRGGGMNCPLQEFVDSPQRHEIAREAGGEEVLAAVLKEARRLLAAEKKG